LVANGTFETSSNVRYPVAIGGKADLTRKAKIDANDPNRKGPSENI
jgi:hypothetical protein